MIKYPGGEIAFWTVLFMLAGTYVSYDAFMAGKTGLGIVFAMMPVGCALIWLGVRQAKWLVVVYLAIATLGALILIFSKGFSWSLAIRGIAAAYGAFEFAVWNGNPKHNERAPRTPLNRTQETFRED
jgi:hypothetical protein